MTPPKTTAPFDLVVTGSEKNGQLLFQMNFKTSLFKRDTIEMLCRNLREVIRAVSDNPDVNLERIPMSRQFIAAGPMEEDEGDFGF